MVAPNLAAPTTITGKTTYLTLANTSETTLLSNASSSNLALRVTAVTATNTTATAASITLTIYTAASGGTGHFMAGSISVPGNSSIVLVARDSSVWLEENRRLTVTAGTANAIAVVCSYEEVA